MKNGIETVDADTVAAFDRALNEECFQYSECSLMKPFVTAGKAVFQVEYKLLTTDFCSQSQTLGFKSMRKRLALDAWREVCW
jgi:Glycoside-hydrolase family GH114